MSAEAIPADATNAVEAIRSFFILIPRRVIHYGPPLENPVSKKTFDAKTDVGQHFQYIFSIDYYD